MIFVTGATGQLGRRTIDALLRTVPPKQIIAGARSYVKAADLRALGVQVREADYARPEHWASALDGVEKLLLISSNEVGERVQQHRTVIAAAKAVPTLKLIAYTSLLRAPTSPLSLAPEHVATEAAILEARLPYTFLRNGWYTENYATAIRAGAASGEMFGAAGGGRIAAASRADYADALAKVATMKPKPKPIYELAGDNGFTMPGLAAAVALAAGRPVVYRDLAPAEYESLLLKAGLPPPVAQMLVSAEAGIARGALFDDGRELSRLIGRPTTSVADVIAATNHPSAH